MPSYIPDWLKSDEPSRRCAAASRLGEFPTTEHLQLLIDRILRETDEWTFGFMVDVIADSFSDGSREALNHILSELSSSPQIFIVLLVAHNYKIQLDEAKLLDLLGTPEWYVRLAVAKSLANSRHTEGLRDMLVQMREEIQGLNLAENSQTPTVEGCDILWDKNAALKLIESLLLGFA